MQTVANNNNSLKPSKNSTSSRAFSTLSILSHVCERRILKGRDGEEEIVLKRADVFQKSSAAFIYGGGDENSV
ncbi:hypothetical protein JTE90_025916 [Oedothorax gibbosus]|uniref:Uncharacterized protein n=1 Tax=Oedothorax gibbosus TaxID=931172 RepID=A0AAV6UT56_9ARAC|nr:hypothetical protein JTE90_025916 [Oedothorax gibbosus]